MRTPFDWCSNIITYKESDDTLYHYSLHRNRWTVNMLVDTEWKVLVNNLPSVQHTAEEIIFFTEAL